MLSFNKILSIGLCTLRFCLTLRASPPARRFIKTPANRLFRFGNRVQNSPRLISNCGCLCRRWNL